MTAVREANQVGALQPTTLVSYHADIDAVFDSRDEDALAFEGMDAAALADRTWRDQTKLNAQARTQVFARRLIAGGYNGLLVRSFAAGSDADDMNLVLWRWGDAPPARLTLIDDEGRLS
jgi:RES domain-containing protein